MNSEFITEFEQNNLRFGITLLNNRDEKSINRFLALFNDCFGQRPGVNLDWYRWFYTNNPLGECHNYGLIDLTTGNLVGTFGYSKTCYFLNNLRCEGRIAVNGMIHKNYSRKGLYSRLIHETSEIEVRDCDILLSFPHCNNKPSIKGHYNAGWNFPRKCNFYSKSDLGKTNAKNVVCVNKIEILKDIKYPALLLSDGFYFSRDYLWLKWRYGNKPNKSYFYLVHNRTAEPVDAYMILSIYQDKTEKRCQIVDFRFMHKESLAALINHAENVAIENKCNRVDVMICESAKELSLFKDLFFSRTDEYYELLLYRKSQQQLVIDPLMGDFDVV